MATAQSPQLLAATQELSRADPSARFVLLVPATPSSDLLSKEGSRELMKLVPHAQFVEVGGAGHMVAGDRNDVFAGAVIEFLTRTVPVDGAPVQPPHEPQPHHLGPPGDVNDVP